MDLKLYFCETCGKRLSSLDLEAGAAKDKKLKGVFCQSCAVGVFTMEMQAVPEIEVKHDNSPHHQASPSATPSKRPTKEVGRTRSPSSGHHPNGPGHDYPKGKEPKVPANAMATWVPVAASAVLLLGTFGALYLMSSGRSADRTVAAPTVAAKPQVPASVSVTPKVVAASPTPVVSEAPPAQPALVAPPLPIADVHPPAPAVAPMAPVAAPPSPVVVAVVPVASGIPAPNSAPVESSAHPPVMPPVAEPVTVGSSMPVANVTPVAAVRAIPSSISGQIRMALSGEILKVGEDRYVEVRYDFQKNPQSLKDFDGPATAGPDGARVKQVIHWSKDFGNSNMFACRAVFQPGALRTEYVVNASQHDIQVNKIGSAYLKTRWIGTGNIHLTAGAVYADPYGTGKPWKHPAAGGTYRYQVDRIPNRFRFMLDDKEMLNEALPAEVPSEKTWSIGFTANTDVVVKEVVIKGFLDAGWLKERMAELSGVPVGKK